MIIGRDILSLIWGLTVRFLYDVTVEWDDSEIPMKDSDTNEDAELS